MGPPRPQSGQRISLLRTAPISSCQPNNSAAFTVAARSASTGGRPRLTSPTNSSAFLPCTPTWAASNPDAIFHTQARGLLNLLLDALQKLIHALALLWSNCWAVLGFYEKLVDHSHRGDQKYPLLRIIGNEKSWY